MMPGTQRHAALLLHGVSESDRHWVLAQLDPAQALALRDLLGELSELGLPRDPSLVDAVLDRQSRAAAPAGLGSASAPQTCELDQTLLLDLACVDPGRVIRALQGEPAALRQAVLQCHAWPWAEEAARAWDLASPLVATTSPAWLPEVLAALHARLCGNPGTLPAGTAAPHRRDRSDARSGPAAQHTHRSETPARSSLARENYSSASGDTAPSPRWWQAGWSRSGWLVFRFLGIAR